MLVETSTDTIGRIERKQKIASYTSVTYVYSYIIDDDRRKNAELFEQAFYEEKNLDPSICMPMWPERQ